MSTHALLRAQAEAYATEESAIRAQSIASDLERGYLAALELALRAAFTAGADAGYTAAKAEERK
jgi:hypothetical protein